MIPNSAPMAAVYLTAAKKPMSRPVAAWSTNGVPLVYVTGLGLNVVEEPVIAEDFIGMWQRGWTPSQDEMASLLPEHVPGTPHPLATRVIIRELSDGWAAYRVENNILLRKETVFNDLEELLSAVGNFHIDKIVHIGDED